MPTAAPRTLDVPSPGAMRALAAALQPLLRPGDLLVLTGEIGAGKTFFVSALAQAMGIDEPVTSPTFTLLHTYEGPLRLHHVDLYRLDDPRELLDLDLPECLDDRAVTAVEWGERGVEAYPEDYLWMRIAVTGPEARSVVLEPVGASWAERLQGLAWP